MASSDETFRSDVAHGSWAQSHDWFVVEATAHGSKRPEHKKVLGIHVDGHLDGYRRKGYRIEAVVWAGPGRKPPKKTGLLGDLASAFFAVGAASASAPRRRSPAAADRVVGDGGNCTVYERPDGSWYALDRTARQTELPQRTRIVGPARFDPRRH